MELRQLTFFVGVADELHFGRAAERLYIAQPALSQHIRRLERELGVDLFDRGRRRIRLTPAGEAFYQEARRTLITAERARAVARQASRGERGRLEIVVGFTAYTNAVAELLWRMRDDAPDLVPELVANDAVSVERELYEGDVSVAILDGPVNVPGTKSRVLAVEPLVAILSPGHPLTELESVTMTDLVAYPLIVASRASGPRVYARVASLVESCPGDHDMSEARNAATLTLAPASGAVVGLSTRSLAERGRPHVVLRPIADPGSSVNVVVAWRDEAASPQLKVLLNALDAITADREQGGRPGDRHIERLSGIA